MSVYVEVRELATDESKTLFSSPNVIGRVLALIVRHEDGGITIERDIAVTADNAEDNELAERVVKDLQTKLEELFPDPNKPEPSKLWVPK